MAKNIKKKQTKKQDKKPVKPIKATYKGKYRAILKKYRESKNGELERLADELLEWFETGESNIYLNDFAIMKRIPREYFTRIYCEKSEYFKEVYEICKEIQASKLMKLGMAVKSNMPIFALKNLAGWRDKQETELSGSVGIKLEVFDLTKPQEEKPKKK